MWDPVEAPQDIVQSARILWPLFLLIKRLTSTRIVLCATPHYLKTHGKPKHPNELAAHQVIGYSYWAGGDTWTFDGADGQGGTVSVKLHPWMSSNNGDTCRAAALAHQGIILQPSFLIEDDLAAGRLVELLPEYRSIALGIYAVYPTRKHVPPKVRALVGFLEERLSALQ